MDEYEKAHYDSVVHNLRSQGWSKQDAEDEALEHIIKRRYSSDVHDY